MKKVLFATTATSALLFAGLASAQGISLFGDARLGMTYNEDRDDELQATSRVRFGVNMTGETDSGITFGASVRADNAVAGENGLAGSTFVSGSLGTLTFGDTSGADENWVGDVPGNLTLTGIGDENETPFISNAGGFEVAAGDGLAFAPNPQARPTVRYDFDIAGFGVSVSTNRLMDDYGVGAGYAGSFGGVDLNVGVGYYDFDGFDTGVGADIQEVADGEQVSATVGAAFGNFALGVVWQNADSDDAEYETVHVGGTAGFGAFTVGAWYVNAIENLDINEEDDSMGLSAEYDLGGGASVKGGVGQNFAGSTIGDFGISMSF
ncbi:porin [Amaricoccus tamworthensis]|uniref:porin n=1 Tax=Amaricoccus tamworthensis TaxID=57002 RepID=UPI003C7CD4E3